jgi:hypothetical protein
MSSLKLVSSDSTRVGASAGGAGNRGDGEPPDINGRLKALEADVTEMKELIGRLALDSTEIKAKLATLSASDIGEIKGKVSQMPTAFQLAA